MVAYKAEEGKDQIFIQLPPAFNMWECESEYLQVLLTLPRANSSKANHRHAQPAEPTYST